MGSLNPAHLPALQLPHFSCRARFLVGVNLLLGLKGREGKRVEEGQGRGRRGATPLWSNGRRMGARQPLGFFL